MCLLSDSPVSISSLVLRCFRGIPPSTARLHHWSSLHRRIRCLPASRHSKNVARDPLTINTNFKWLLTKTNLSLQSNKELLDPPERLCCPWFPLSLLTSRPQAAENLHSGARLPAWGPQDCFLPSPLKSATLPLLHLHIYWEDNYSNFLFFTCSTQKTSTKLTSEAVIEDSAPLLQFQFFHSIILVPHLDVQVTGKKSRTEALEMPAWALVFHFNPCQFVV